MRLPYIPLLSKVIQVFVVAEHGGVQLPPRRTPPRTHLAQRQAEYNGVVICECSRQNVNACYSRRYVARYVYSVNTTDARVRVMCIGWWGRILLPRIGNMKPTHHLGEGPASMEIAGCVSWIKDTIEVAPMMIFPCPVCNSCETSAL